MALQTCRRLMCLFSGCIQSSNKWYGHCPILYTQRVQDRTTPLRVKARGKHPNCPKAARRLSAGTSWATKPNTATNATRRSRHPASSGSTSSWESTRTRRAGIPALCVTCNLSSWEHCRCTRRFSTRERNLPPNRKMIAPPTKEVSKVGVLCVDHSF